ncbi:hypothetical protein HDE_06085 [Halotydeus destructor]|nr:hypothetical protein HDE_06085 [Halotydeus destructor]
MIFQPSMRRKKKVEYVIFAVCVIGFLIQQKVLIEFYLEYQVVTLTKVFIPETVEIPSIYVCTQYVSPFDGPKSSLADRLAQAFNYTEMELVCRVLRKNGSYVPCARLTNTQVYYTSSLLCVAKFEESDLTSEMSEITYRSSRLHQALFEYSAKLVRLEPMSNQLLFSVGMRHEAKFRTRNSDSLVSLNGNITSHLSLTFAKKYFKYKPAPYTRNCIDYTVQYNIERRELVDRCVMARSVTHPYGVLTTLDGESTSKALSSLSNMDFQKVNRACQEKYHHIDCDDISYFVETQSQRYTANGTADTVHFKLLRLNGPDMSVEEEPRLDLFNFSINLGGFMSLWLGISFVDIFENILRRSFKGLKRLHHKKQFVPKKQPKLAHLTKMKMTGVYVVAMFTLGLGCGLSIFSFAENAIENPFITETLLSKPLTFQLPTISICKARLEKQSLLKAISTHNIGNIIDNRAQLYELLSIRDLMKVSLSVDEVIDMNQTFINLPNASRVAYSNLYKTKMSITMKEQCFTLFSPKQLVQDAMPANYTTANFVMIMLGIVYLKNVPGQSRFTVTYHHGDSFNAYVSGTDTKTFTYGSNIANYYELTFGMVSSEKVDNHRKSTCMDYRSLNYESQFDAILDCIIKRFQRENPGYWPSMIYAAEDADKLHHNIDAKFKEKSIDNLTEYCLKKFHSEDCIKTYFTPKVTWSLLFNRTEMGLDRYTRLSLNVPYGIEIKFREIVKYRFVELISYFGSLLGVWLGLSIFTIIFSPASLVCEKTHYFFDFTHSYVEALRDRKR